MSRAISRVAGATATSPQRSNSWYCRYEASPKTFKVAVPGHSGKVNVMISGGMLVQWAVSPGTHFAAKMPASIDALANGDPGPIASTWATPKLDPAGIGVVSNGLFNGVACGEWVPYETREERRRRRAARFPGVSAFDLEERSQPAVHAPELSRLERARRFF